MLLFEVTCGPIVFFLMINRVFWKETGSWESREEGGGPKESDRRPACEGTQPGFQGHRRPNWWEHFLN